MLTPLSIPLLQKYLIVLYWTGSLNKPLFIQVGVLRFYGNQKWASCLEKKKKLSNINFRGFSSKRSDLSLRNPLYFGSSHAHPSTHTPALTVSQSLLLEQHREKASISQV